VPVLFQHGQAAGREHDPLLNTGLATAPGVGSNSPARCCSARRINRHGQLFTGSFASAIALPPAMANDDGGEKSRQRTALR
jgi:hypothetical protein